MAPGGGEVYALAIDAEAAMIEYLELFYKLGRAGGALRKLGAVDFATTIAPGLRDVLLTGKTYEAVRRRTKDGSPVYDAVVMDAPPTGRIARFLNVNTRSLGLAQVGPIRNQADSIMSCCSRRRQRCTSSLCSRRCRSRKRSTGSRNCARPSCPWARSSSTSCASLTYPPPT